MIKKNNNHTTTSRTGYIGMERDSELGLAEHGVRKYDEAIGSFTAPDALWEKYVGWSPYQYSLNNPVMFSDGNGYLIILQNLTNDQQTQWNANINYLNNLGSPTVNRILDVANSDNNSIYVNFLPRQRPVNGNTPSNIGRSKTLESEWNYDKYGQKRVSTGLTLTVGSKLNVADVIIDSDHVEGNMFNGDVNPMGISILTIIDELHHAISQERSNDKEKNDHKKLFEALLEEHNSGKIELSPTVIDQINEKLKEDKK